jgi:hypothetical protein
MSSQHEIFHMVGSFSFLVPRDRSGALQARLSPNWQSLKSRMAPCLGRATNIKDMIQRSKGCDPASHTRGGLAVYRIS